MHPDWQHFLEAQGASVTADGGVVFSGAPVVPTCALADLSYLGLIRVTGEDQVAFLQGQLTNDVSQLTPTSSHLSAFCNPKGRMLALFRVFVRDDALLLQLPLERLAPVLKRLSMYVLRSKVTLEDVSDDLVRIGLAGECIGELLPEALPMADNAIVPHGQLTLIRLPGDRPRVEVIGPADAVIALWQQAARVGEPAGPDCWPLLDIRAAQPSVFEATAEAFVPQMTNLQLIDGVSFTKGCYTGQEVVARMHYLGKLKRRMYRFELAAAAPPAPGTALFATTGDEQSVGRVVDARSGPEGRVEGLAVVQIDAASAGALRLEAPGGAAISLVDPPYPFEAASDAG